MVHCSENSLCDALKERLRRRGYKGFVQIDFICQTKGTDRGSYVIYCKEKDDPGLALNFCPFCGFAFHAVYKKGKRLSLRGEQKPKRKLKVAKLP